MKVKGMEWFRLISKVENQIKLDEGIKENEANKLLSGVEKGGASPL